MAREVKISETNPFEDALFQIRAECNRPGLKPEGKMRNIWIIMQAFEDTMKSLQERKLIPLQNWPTGTDE